MTNLDQVKFVTQHYYDLHGLRWVIWGVVCFFIALEEIGVMPKFWFLVAVFPIGLAGLIGATGYYMHRYGTVVGAKRGHGSALWTLLALAALFAGFAADKWLGVRPFLMPVTFALWFLLQFWMVGRKWRQYYLWIALGIIGVNLTVGVLPFPAGSPLLVAGFVTWILVGVAMLIGGWLDHRLVVRTLGRRVAEDVGTA